MTIDFDKMGGLVPAIIQDADTRQVLMLGFMNKEAYQKTLLTKKVTFWSRTRQKLWTKGETSGNFLDLVSIAVDCDNDTLLVKVHPHGPTCHTGTDTCWGETNSMQQTADPSDNPLAFLTELQNFIEKRHEQMPEGSYTTRLFRDGTAKMAQKVGEEALETVIEAVGNNDEKLIYEASDMIYHLMVLLTSKGLRLDDIVNELQRRHDPQWDAKRRQQKAEE
jgi:phosphoribosyl-ATP pyrophosphohydrolase/phosphoribosyl-AMP cyclohydrolase